MLVCFFPLKLIFADSAEIQRSKDTVNRLWQELKKHAERRTLALAGAKEIHTFDRDAGDAKERVQVSECLWLVFGPPPPHNHVVWEMSLTSSQGFSKMSGVYETNLVKGGLGS